MCPTILLSQKDQTVISYCPECKRTYIWHKSLMLTFENKQFLAFKKYIKNSDHTFLAFPDDEERILISTQHSQVNLIFSENEWTCFLTAIEEAEYMHEVYQLLY
ncbi:DUF6686 family protein [Pseudopedobacter beijingensis]|uniref:DUF6686 family protein n=1 Tax=Pseudopedobacter beijingensis TaxID=1207056 RepID=A0ABW4I7J0_9SPHI